MVAFGLILLLIGVGAGGWLAWLALQSETGVTLGATGLQLTVLPITLFVAGAASMLLLWLGVRFMALGTKRRVARRKELKELRTAPRPPVARVREALTVSKVPTGSARASPRGGSGRPRPRPARSRRDGDFDRTLARHRTRHEPARG